MTDAKTNAKPVLTGDIYERDSFADADNSGTIDLGLLTNEDRERIYQMAEQSSSRIQAVEVPKSKGQTYYDEVEALKSGGMSNADAIREVAKRHDKEANAVRGGIHQYKKNHVNGDAPTTTRRSRRSASLSVDDYLANARQALESARDLIDHEVSDAKAGLDAAQARYDEVQASVKERKADIQKKLKALS